MSYNGTVRCSHCYKTGHNRRKCPELTEEIKGYYTGATSMAAKEREQGNEQDAEWYDQRAEVYRQQYIKRTKIDLATGKKVTNKVAKAERMKKVTCGYCGQRGHTRRTCQNAKNDYEVYKVLTRRARLQWYDNFKSTGAGVGSMVVNRNVSGYFPDGSYGTQTVTGLITGINWDAIDGHSEQRPIIVKSNADLKGQQGYYAHRLSRLNVDHVMSADTAINRNLSVIPSGHIPDMPAGWLDDVKPIKEVFETSEGRPYDYKYSDHPEIVQARADLGLPNCAYSS